MYNMNKDGGFYFRYEDISCDWLFCGSSVFCCSGV